MTTKFTIGNPYTLTLHHRPKKNRGSFFETISVIVRSVELLGQSDDYKTITVDQIIGIDHYIDGELDKVQFVSRTFYKDQIQTIGYQIGVR